MIKNLYKLLSKKFVMYVIKFPETCMKYVWLKRRVLFIHTSNCTWLRDLMSLGHICKVENSQSPWNDRLSLPGVKSSPSKLHVNTLPFLLPLTLFDNHYKGIFVQVLHTSKMSWCTAVSYFGGLCFRSQSEGQLSWVPFSYFLLVPTDIYQDSTLK
jgi:hypothetical protein